MLVALLLGVMASQSALAFGGRGRSHGYGHGHGHGNSHFGVGFGLFVGVPLLAYSLHRPYYAPPYYYGPRAYYPPVIVTQPAPTVYIEQSEVQPPAVQSAPQVAPQAAPQAAPQLSWWYYCADAQAYYPYVKQCPAGWQRVAPKPQG